VSGGNGGFGASVLASATGSPTRVKHSQQVLSAGSSAAPQCGHVATGVNLVLGLFSTDDIFGHRWPITIRY
jgi:hypothetical protein